MPRRSSNLKRNIRPDIKYSSTLMSKFINYLMKKGKKSVAQKIVYGALDILKNKYNHEPLSSFENAINNLKPSVEVKSVRVGGANYQVPHITDTHRSNTLAMRWLIKASSSRAEKNMKTSLAEELLDSLNNKGIAIKIKQDTHKMAEANKSFAHFSPKKKVTTQK